MISSIDSAPKLEPRKHNKEFLEDLWSYTPSDCSDVGNYQK